MSYSVTLRVKQPHKTEDFDFHFDSRKAVSNMLKGYLQLGFFGRRRWIKNLHKAGINRSSRKLTETLSFTLVAGHHPNGCNHI